jgi:hypothetical protein
MGAFVSGEELLARSAIWSKELGKISKKEKKV